MSVLADRIRGVEDILNYQFTETRNIQEALTLAGGYSGLSMMSDGNKSLALVGDTAIRLVLVVDGYKAHKPKRAIADMIEATGGNANLSSVGSLGQIDQYIYTNPSQHGVSPKSMATTVEAILGAVFLDSGENIEAVKRAMLGLGMIWSHQ